jgi:hypothetical protein
MKPLQNTIRTFYQNLGKIFYAVAAAGHKVKQKELDLLKEIAKNKWPKIALVDTHFDRADVFEIETIFDWLSRQDDYDSAKCFSDFIFFKKEHPSLFTPKINDLILNTSNQIAASFAGLNKSELMLLAKLSIELKKTK